MRKVCNNCRWISEKRNYMPQRRWCYCCSPDIETRELDCDKVYRHRPDWCPGFTEPPEELPEDMKEIFKPEKEEDMSKAEEQLEKLYDYIAENYGSYSRIFYDDVEMAIETMEKQERYNNVLNEKLKELDKELDRLQDYIVENYGNYQRDNFDDIRVNMAIEVIEQHKEYEDKLKNMVSNLKDERERLEDKLTKLSNAYICNMVSQLEIENPESYIKEQVDKMFRDGGVPEEYLNTEKDNKLAKEVARVVEYLDNKYPEFYKEHGWRRFSDVIIILTLKLDG